MCSTLKALAVKMPELLLLEVFMGPEFQTPEMYWKLLD